MVRKGTRKAAAVEAVPAKELTAFEEAIELCSSGPTSKLSSYAVATQDVADKWRDLLKKVLILLRFFKKDASTYSFSHRCLTRCLKAVRPLGPKRCL
jgi:hypothetical protein